MLTINDRPGWLEPLKGLTVWGEVSDQGVSCLSGLIAHTQLLRRLWGRFGVLHSYLLQRLWLWAHLYVWWLCLTHKHLWGNSRECLKGVAMAEHLGIFRNPFLCFIRSLSLPLWCIGLLEITSLKCRLLAISLSYRIRNRSSFNFLTHFIQLFLICWVSFWAFVVLGLFPTRRGCCASNTRDCDLRWEWV